MFWLTISLLQNWKHVSCAAQFVFFCQRTLHKKYETISKLRVKGAWVALILGHRLGKFEHGKALIFRPFSPNPAWNSWYGLEKRKISAIPALFRAQFYREKWRCITATKAAYSRAFFGQFVFSNRVKYRGKMQPQIQKQPTDFACR